VYAVLVDFDQQHTVTIADGRMQCREGEAEIGVVAHEVRQRPAIDGERRRARHHGGIWVGFLVLGRSLANSSVTLVRLVLPQQSDGYGHAVLVQAAKYLFTASEIGVFKALERGAPTWRSSFAIEHRAYDTSTCRGRFVEV